MTFEEAVLELRKGRCITRKCWEKYDRYWQYREADNAVYNDDGNMIMRDAFGKRIDPFANIGGDDWEIYQPAPNTNKEA